MGEPIALQDLFFGTMSGAAIVLMGAFYALFFALGRLNNSRALMIASTISYVFLVAAAFVLIDALSLKGFWIFVAVTMLIGYFFAPRGIWHLCVGTHVHESAADNLRDTQTRATP